MTTREPQPPADRVGEKTVEVVLVVEKKAKPVELLFIKCKDDWIHHLAQALAFSLLTTLVPVAILLLTIFNWILARLGSSTRHVLSGQLNSIMPASLESQATQLFNNAFTTFSHAPGFAALVVAFLVYVWLGSLLFSLMESCFDVIYHLPPRPFVRRHIIAIGMLFLYIALAPLIIIASAAPTLILTLLHAIPSGEIHGSNFIFNLAEFVGRVLLSLILFQAIYVVVPHRHVTPATIGRHIRNSWHGTLVATITWQLLLRLFPVYASHFMSSYIGQAGFVFILLLYFYLFTLILLFGAEVNAFFAEGIRVPRNDLITQASKDSYLEVLS